MKLVPALEYEKLREDAQSWNKIIVHKEGKFYHAYEWSAWLLKTFVCTEEFQQQRGDSKMLAVNRYKAKEKEYVMLGFPVESVSKYIPSYESLDDMEDNSGIIVSIDLGFDESVSYEQLCADFEEWKESCPMKENKVKSRKDITNGDGRAAALCKSGIFSILTQVLSYPVESTTPSQNIEFISKLKHDVASLL